MKLQEIIRGSVVVMGLGIALFFASPVRAQQDMSPDTFDINPGTPTEVAVAVQVPAPVGVQDNGVAQAAIMPASNWDGTFAAPLNAVDVTMVADLGGWNRIGCALHGGGDAPPASTRIPRKQQRIRCQLWRDDPLNSFARHRAPGIAPSPRRDSRSFFLSG